MTPERLTYTFGPLERRGLLGSIRAGQAIVLSTGTLLAIGLLDQSPTAGGAAAATVAFGIAVALALIRVGRRTADEWAPVAVSFAIRRTLRTTLFRSSAPTEGVVATRLGGRHASVGRLPAHPPPSLRDVHVLVAEHAGRPIGVLASSRGRRLVAVLACQVIAFSLLDADAQERQLARWGLVLSGAAGTPTRRIQWVERTVPAQGDELARWVAAEHDPAIPLRGTSVIESYLSGDQIG